MQCYGWVNGMQETIRRHKHTRGDNVEINPPPQILYNVVRKVHMILDREKCRALLNTLMKFRVHKFWKIS